MHLVIYPDGRTSRHGDLFDVRHDITVPGRTDFERAQGSFNGQTPLPLPCPEPVDGIRFTLWVAEPTVTRGEGLRNVPASLLGAQFGLPARPLAGPVVVTSGGSSASGMVVDTRWSYVESLVEDITRAIYGLTPSVAVADPAWPHAIRLAAAVLEAADRRIPEGLRGDAAVEHLMRDLGFGRWDEEPWSPLDDRLGGVVASEFEARDSGDRAGG